jgi:glycosyltransferase involved in cell wall biosynthesis
LKQNTIVISGINMVEGGIFTILDNCLQKVSIYSKINTIKVIALVHDKSKFNYPNIDYIEFPKAKKYWISRLYYEYFYFNTLSKIIKPDAWLSLHDVTPNVVAKKRFVYCHNPTVFYESTYKDWKFNYKIGMFSIFYKFVYQINLAKNTAVFVQQNWIKKEFEQLFKSKNIFVARPENVKENQLIEVHLNPNKIHFFYPSFPRSFKNFELIGEAVKVLPDSIKNQIEVHLTFSKSDNKYAKYIVNKYHFEPLRFIGKISRSEVFGYYKKMDCLLFPSKLETWGLPITEAKGFEKPVLLANLPYAKETVGNYDKVSFFDIENPKELAQLITDFVNKTIQYQGNKDIFDTSDQLKDWNTIFDFMLKN